jgi:hypothetical protein
MPHATLLVKQGDGLGPHMLAAAGRHHVHGQAAAGLLQHGKTQVSTEVALENDLVAVDAIEQIDDALRPLFRGGGARDILQDIEDAVVAQGDGNYALCGAAVAARARRIETDDDALEPVLWRTVTNTPAVDEIAGPQRALDVLEDFASSSWRPSRVPW